LEEALYLSSDRILNDAYVAVGRTWSCRAGFVLGEEGAETQPVALALHALCQSRGTSGAANVPRLHDEKGYGCPLRHSVPISALTVLLLH
jgi:hypothetical protein